MSHVERKVALGALACSLALALLKVCGFIAWPWWAITLPIAILVAIVLVVLVLTVVLGVVILIVAAICMFATWRSG